MKYITPVHVYLILLAFFLLLILSPNFAGAQVNVLQGGTGLTSVTANYILYGVDAFRLGREAAFNYNPSTNTLTVDNVTVSGTCSGCSGTALATSSPWTATNLAVVKDNGTIESVGTTTLSETITGLEFSANPVIVGSTARTLALTSGYTIPTSASTTAWDAFHGVPSSVIAAGTGIDWTTNTLNVTGVPASSLTLADGSILVGGNGGTAEATSSISIADNGSVTIGDTIITDGNGLLIGNASQVTVNGTNELQVLGTAVADSGITLGKWAAANTGPQFNFVKSRNATIGSNTIVQDNDVLGALRWYPDDGTDFNTAAAIYEVQVDDASPAANDIGVAHVWWGLPGGAGALTELMRIAATGNLGIGDISPASLLTVGSGDLFQVNSSGVIAAIAGLSGATGTYDFGGVTSFEIPNAENNTVDATGEISIDTSVYGAIEVDMGTSTVAFAADFDKSWSVSSTSPDYLGNSFSTATSTWEVAHFRRGVTLNSVYCETNDGTVKVRVGDGTNFTEEIAASATPTADDSLSNNTWTEREDMIIEIGTAATSPDWVTCDLNLNYTLQ